MTERVVIIQGVQQGHSMFGLKVKATIHNQWNLPSAGGRPITCTRHVSDALSWCTAGRPATEGCARCQLLVATGGGE